jgi:hypothetical protein
MVDTIALSIPAVDVLGEQLNLNVRQYPFEIPRVGESPEERERIVRQVWSELETAGLADSRGPQPEVEDALYLLCSSEVSIAAAGVLDLRSGQRLAARVVATGEVGVVGMIDGRGLRMDFMAPDDLPSVCVDLLPDAPPGAGEPARTAAQRSANGRHDPPGTQADAEGLRAVEAIIGRPKFRLGHYIVTSIDRRGRRGRLPGLTWFDNDNGRYVLLGERSADGPDALTCFPADKPRIAEQISSMLQRAG